MLDLNRPAQLQRLSKSLESLDFTGTILSKQRTTKMLVRDWSAPLLFAYAIRQIFSYRVSNEPRHDKTNKVTVRPAKTQISLGIRPV